MFHYVAASLVAAALVVTTQAGEFNKKLKIGDPAPSFSDLEGVDGKKMSLADLKDKEVVVLCITCNHCPVAVAYEDRMNDFAKKYAGPESKVAFVAISVNNLEADKLPKMKERAKKKGFVFPYLHDPSQKIGRDLGASVTPEFFVFDKDRKVVYMGAFDDNRKPNLVKSKYVIEAVEATLKGSKPKKAETRPVGCSVKYDK